MPTYRITDPDSGQSFKITGDSPPSEQELNQIFAARKGASIGEKTLPSVSTQGSPGFFSRVGTDLANRGRNIGKEYQASSDETMPETLRRVPGRLLRTAGEVAGGIGDPIQETIKSLYTTLTPQAFQDAVKEALAKAGTQSQQITEEQVARINREQPGANAKARSLTQGVQEDVLSPLEKEAPGATKNLEAIANVLALAAGSKMSGVKAAERIALPERIKALNLSRLDLSKLPPEVADRVKAGLEAGVDLSPAALKQTKPLAQLESMFDKNITSSGIAEKAYKENIAQAEAYAKHLQRNIGGKTTMLEAGEKAQQMAKGRYGAFMQKAQQLYKDIPVEPDTLIETNNLRDTAVGMLDELGKIDAPAVKRVLNVAKESTEPGMQFRPGTPAAESTLSDPFRQYGAVTIGKKPPMTTSTIPAGTGGIVDATGNPFVGANMPKYTWQELLGDRNSLNQMWRQSADPNRKRILGHLVDAIDDDIAKFSTVKPGVKEAFDKALNFYKFGDEKVPGVRTFRDRQIKAVFETTSPEDVVNKFIKPNNVSDITRLASASGPEGMQPIKQAWLDKLLTKGEEASFSPRKFATAFDKYDEATLKSFLTSDEINGLKTLSKVSKLLGKAEQIAGNPSGTAQHVITGGYLMNLVRHPVITVATGLGSNRFAKLYFENPTFRRALVEGIQVGANTKRAINSAAKMTAIVGTAAPSLAPIATTSALQSKEKR